MVAKAGARTWRRGPGRGGSPRRIKRPRRLGRPAPRRGSWPRPSPAVSHLAADQLLEADRGPRRERELAVAVKQPGAGQVPHRALDRVPGAEVGGVGEVEDQLLDRDLDRMQEEDLAQDGRLDVVVLAGGAHAVLDFSHGPNPFSAAS